MLMIKLLIGNLLKLPYRIFFSKISLCSFVRKSDIDKTAAICMGSRVYDSRVDRYSFVGKNTFIYKTSVGAFTSISNNCYIGSLSHPMNWVSTSSVFHKGNNVLKKNFSEHDFISYKQTYIGNDVWVGEGCKIKAGVTIGDGAVIGMGSIVTKDVEPYAVYAGNPAKKIKDRFDDDLAEKIKRSMWWKWSDEKIACYSSFFNNPKSFVQQVEK